MPEVGQWGPESFVDRHGRPTPGVTVTIYEIDGVTPATLYADQAGVVVLANPLPVGVASTAAGLDDRANGSFYAPPGPYVMAVVRGGVEVYRSPVTVGVDTPGGGGGGAVDSVNGKVGVVVLVASEIGSTATGDVVATNVQAAIAELASEKATAASVTAEATARAGADTTINAALLAEINDRIAADLLLIPLAQKGAASGVATLDGNSTIPTNQLPSLAINETFTAASQAAMLALTAQRGDVAIRTDLDPDGFFLLVTDSPGTLADWKQILSPGAVQSVDGRSGTVSLADLYDAAGLAAAAQAAAIQRANHTGSQAESTVTGLVADLAAKETPAGAQAKVDVETTARIAGDNALDTRLDVVEPKVAHLTVTQAVDLDTIEARVNSLDAAVVLRGSWDASAGTFPGGGTAQAGDSYIVSVSGTVNAVAFVVGDRVVAIVDNASTSTYAANWLKLDYTDQVLSVDGRVGAITLADLYDPLGAAATVQGLAVLKSNYNANTILRATADDDPTPLTMGPSTILVRLASGDIIAGTPAQLRTLLAIAAVDVPITDAAGDFTASEVEGALAELQTFDEALESLQPGEGTTPVSGGGFVQIDLLPDIEVESVKLAGGVVATAARLATAIWLPAVTYANGSLGVGATLTANTLTSQSFARSGTVVTVTSTTHGISPGAVAQISASSDTAALPNGDYTVVTIVDANNFTITGVNAGGTSGMTATVIFRGLIDGVLPALNDDVVIKNQASQFQNGLYTMTTQGTGATAPVFTRRTNADQAADYAQGISVTIADGQAYSGAVLISSPLAVTMGTTAISFRGVSRPRVTPVDVRLGPNRDRRRYETDFEELDAAIVVASGASQRIPGTIWTVNMVGTLSTATQQNESNVVSGAIDLATGTTTTGFCAVQGGMGAIIFDSTRRYSFACRYKTPTQSSAAELFVCKMGHMVSLVTGATQTAGIYFEIPSSGNILAVVANASTGLAGVDTGVAGSTGFRTLWWEYDPVTLAVTFFTTVGSIPVLLATISTNLPTVALATGAQILKAGGSPTGILSRSLRVDYIASDQIDNRNILVS